MNPGKYTVSVAAFVALACLSAGSAGRRSETGMGVEWLVASAGAVAQPCSEPVAAQPASLVFEIIRIGDAETGLPELFAANARELVNFEWNPATSELSYHTTTATRIFSDLERSSAKPSPPTGRSCGSR